MTTLTDLKHMHRATWAAGDYAAVAEHIDTVPPSDLLDRIPIAPGQDVLDVAAGTGNAALRAAAKGARVTGLDLAPELFVTARRRAAELARVCRPGGHIGLINWTPTGVIGEFFQIMSGYLLAPPAFASPPPLWGSEAHVRADGQGAPTPDRRGAVGRLPC